MNDAVFIADIDIGAGGSGWIEEGIHLSRTAVEHENLAKVGAGGAKQVEAVRLGLGEGLLVPEDDACRIVLDPAQANKASPFRDRLAAGNLEGLGVAIEGRLWILPQHPGLPPVPKRRGRPGIDILGRGIRVKPRPRMIRTRL